MPKTIEIPLINIGDRLRDEESDREYRVLVIYSNNAVLCEITKKHSRLNIFDRGMREIITDLTLGNLTKVDEVVPLIDLSNISEKKREKYESRLALVTDLQKVYGPDWKGLTGHVFKAEFEEICKKHGFPKRTARFWVNPER